MRDFGFLYNYNFTKPTARANLEKLPVQRPTVQQVPRRKFNVDPEVLGAVGAQVLSKAGTDPYGAILDAIGSFPQMMAQMKQRRKEEAIFDEDRTRRLERENFEFDAAKEAERRRSQEAGRKTVEEMQKKRSLEVLSDMFGVENPGSMEALEIFVDDKRARELAASKAEARITELEKRAEDAEGLLRVRYGLMGDLDDRKARNRPEPKPVLRADPQGRMVLYPPGGTPQVIYDPGVDPKDVGSLAAKILNSTRGYYSKESRDDAYDFALDEANKFFGSQQGSRELPGPITLKEDPRKLPIALKSGAPSGESVDGYLAQVPNVGAARKNAADRVQRMRAEGKSEDEITAYLRGIFEKMRSQK